MSPTQAIYEGQNWQTQLGGVTENYLDIRNWNLTAGNFFNEYDVKRGTRVTVIGQTVKKELFDSTNPVNKTIRINKKPFKIIGVLEERGKLPDGRDEDDVIFMPITTAQRKLLGRKNKNFSAIIISIKDKERMNIASNEIRAIIRQQHKLSPQDEDDFTIFTQSDISEAAEETSKILNLLLFIIASISLIVGGIGIMNIMLVTVTERTKEIGIRMALGATTQTILNQFMLEAIIICLIGGLMGISFGILIAKFVGHALHWPIFISSTSILISLVSSILIGLFFGFYPAKKASNLNPIEALAER